MLQKSIFDMVEKKLEIYSATMDVQKLDSLEDYSDELYDNLIILDSYVSKNYEYCIEELSLLVQVIIKIALKKMEMLKTVEQEDSKEVRKLINSRKLNVNSTATREENLDFMIFQLKIKMQTANKFYKSFPSEKSLKDLLKFIENRPDIMMKDRQLKTFESIPELMPTDPELFKSLMIAHNAIVMKRKLLKKEEDRKKTEIFKIKVEEEAVAPVISEPNKQYEETIVDTNDNYIEEVIDEDLVNMAELFINNFYSGNEINYLLDLLPSKTDSNYYKVGYAILNRFEEEYEVCQKALSMYREPLFEDRIASLDLYIKTLRTYFSSQEIVENLQEDEVDEENNIYYAHTPKGNSYLEGDLSSPDFDDKECKDAITFLMGKLKTGSFLYNLKESRKFTKNKDLKGVYELKKGNSRLMFLRLPSNNIFVIMAAVKRSQNATYDIERIKDRLKKTTEEYENLKTVIQHEYQNKDNTVRVRR